MSNRPPFGSALERMSGTDMRHLMHMHITPQGPSLPDHLMEKFGDIAAEMALNALKTPLWTVRTLGVNLDPAMKEMDSLAKSCKIKNLDWSGVTGTGVEDKMDQGVNKSHEYAPISTAFPADLLRGLIPFPPYASWSFFKALYKFSNFIIK